MRPDIDALANAVQQRRMHIATFDVGLRERTGQWHLERRIPIEDAIDWLRDHPAFLTDDVQVLLPLHESESAALTGEYLVLDSSRDQVQFYDPGHSSLRSISFDHIARAYPAWQLRFWTGAYPLPEDPPFVHTVHTSPAQVDHNDERLHGTADESSTQSFIEVVRSSIVRRRELQREAARSSFMKLSSEDFIAENGGVDGLKPAGREVDEFGQQQISLVLPADHPQRELTSEQFSSTTGLEPGDEILIDSADVDELPVEAELLEIDPPHLHLGIYWDSATGTQPERAFDTQDVDGFTIGKLIDGAWFDALVESLETVAHHDSAKRLYSGAGELSFDAEVIEPELTELNRRQAEAVTKALRADDLCCIHSPPWTGVRRTIWHILKHEIGNDRRVLLVSPTDRSLRTLLHTGEEGTGSIRSRIASADLRSVVLTETPMDTPGEIDPGTVVASDLHQAIGLPDHSFDVAIFDRAADVSVPAGAILLAKADRVILFGDPMQSPRPSEGQAGEGSLALSIYDHFEDAYGPGAVTRLRCQYGMNQAVALFPNRAFYDGRLIHGGEVRTAEIPGLSPVEAVQVEGRERETPTNSFINEAEVQVVLEEIRQLLHHGLTPQEIGILTPYSAQIGKIRVALNDERGGLGEEVEIGAVERFGCIRKRAIIISTVRTSDPTEWDGPDEPFWTDAGLNIALTRGEQRVVLVGDIQQLARPPSIDGSTAFGELFEHLQSHNLVSQRM